MSKVRKGFECRPSASERPGLAASVGKPTKNERAGKRWGVDSRRDVRQLMKHAFPPPPARTRNTVLYVLQYQAVADRLAVLTEEQIS